MRSAEPIPVPPPALIKIDAAGTILRVQAVPHDYRIEFGPTSRDPWEMNPREALALAKALTAAEKATRTPESAAPPDEETTAAELANAVITVRDHLRRLHLIDFGTVGLLEEWLMTLQKVLADPASGMARDRLGQLVAAMEQDAARRRGDAQ